MFESKDDGIKQMEGDYVGNMKPVFELGFSTKFLNDMKKLNDEMEPLVWKEVSAIDKSTHIISEDKLGIILNFRRKMERNLHSRTLLSLGLFEKYIIHCEYLISICNEIKMVDNNGLPLTILSEWVSRLSKDVEKLKKYKSKEILELIVKVNNSFSDIEYTDEDLELASIDNLIVFSFITVEKLEYFDRFHRNGDKELIAYKPSELR